MPQILSSVSIDIDVPIETVFAYAADLENFPTWFPGVQTIQAQDTKDIDDIGKTYSEVVNLLFGRRIRVRIRVVQAARPLKIATEGDFRLFLPRMEMEFQSLGNDRTRMRWSMYSRRSDITSRMFLPLIRMTVCSRSRTALSRLKTQLERENQRTR